MSQSDVIVNIHDQDLGLLSSQGITAAISLCLLKLQSGNYLTARAVCVGRGVLSAETRPAIFPTHCACRIILGFCKLGFVALLPQNDQSNRHSLSLCSMTIAQSILPWRSCCVCECTSPMAARAAGLMRGATEALPVSKTARPRDGERTRPISARSRCQSGGESIKRARQHSMPWQCLAQHANASSDAKRASVQDQRTAGGRDTPEQQKDAYCTHRIQRCEVIFHRAMLPTKR